MTHQEAAALLGTRDSKKVGNNTYLERLPGGCFGVRLHNTVVVRIFPTGVYSLHTGGWQTVTTKDRINAYAPARVHARKRKWYLGCGVEFVEGIRINAAGDPTETE